MIDLEAESVISELIDRDYKIGIVTYNSSEPVRNVLKRYNLNIEVIFGHEEIEDKTDGIKKAMKELGSVSERSIYVGDHSNDILEARAAGVRSVAVPSGFMTREELAEHQPDLILDKLEDLLQYVGYNN